MTSAAAFKSIREADSKIGIFIDVPVWAFYTVNLFFLIQTTETVEERLLYQREGIAQRGHPAIVPVEGERLKYSSASA